MALFARRSFQRPDGRSPPWSEPGAPDGGSTKRTIFPRRHLLLHILSVRMPLLGGSGFISESVHHLFFWLAVPPPGFAAASRIASHLGRDPSRAHWARHVDQWASTPDEMGLVLPGHAVETTQSFPFFSRSTSIMACGIFDTFQRNHQSCISRSKSLVVYRTIFWLPRS